MSQLVTIQAFPIPNAVGFANITLIDETEHWRLPFNNLKMSEEDIQDLKNPKRMPSYWARHMYLEDILNKQQLEDYDEWLLENKASYEVMEELIGQGIKFECAVHAAMNATFGKYI
jgi:hypothetical protein